jgi:hypothetical protein
MVFGRIWVRVSRKAVINRVDLESKAFFTKY